ncbi:MAG TPA: hypothetical protein VMJ70_00975 [Candidatus Sulfotelmatobacter sp.]|nr:hypothetical protein [Candidatus Sulfotelmatobacter sp.]
MHARYAAVLLAASLAFAAVSAQAAIFDTPTFTLTDVGSAKWTLTVTAGPSGAPSGFSVYWMTQADYDDYGDVWPSSLSYPTLHWAQFTGTPTLNTFDDTVTSFILGPNQSVQIEIGDLFDETGVSTNTPDEMDANQNYVGCVYANSGTGGTRSDYSLNAVGSTIDKESCVKTQGYWKTHSSAWPVSSLMLGTVTYTKTQLLSILGQPAGGNGLISLAHQLIATKLNIAMGADPTPVSSTVAAADAQIGALVVPPVGSGYLSPSSTSHKTQILDDYNNGKYHVRCGTTPANESTWGRLKSLYR